MQHLSRLGAPRGALPYAPTRRPVHGARLHLRPYPRHFRRPTGPAPPLQPHSRRSPPPPPPLAVPPPPPPPAAPPPYPAPAAPGALAVALARRQAIAVELATAEQLFTAAPPGSIQQRVALMTATALAHESTALEATIAAVSLQPIHSSG